MQIFSKVLPSLETIHWSKYTCPGTAGMRSNVSCWSWVSTALGGLSVTPRAGVKVDQQPDGFMFPHSFSLFSYCGRYPRASQILKRDGISWKSLLLLQSRRYELLSSIKKSLKHIPRVFKLSAMILKKIYKCMVLFFFFSTFSSTWGQKCHTYPPLKIKTGQSSQSCGHTNRLFCFLRHRLCCSCLLGRRLWITLFFFLPSDPTPHKQAVLNGRESISGEWFQYSWNCLACKTSCMTNLLSL